MSASARYTRRPPLNCTARDLALTKLYENVPSLRSTIDAALKQLRNCARALTPLDPCLHAELRVLERLYYKNLNQHRAALFWKRAQEVRRLALRVHEARLLSLAEDARAAFYNFQTAGDGTAQNSRKAMNVAWTHVPSVQFLAYVHKRAICTLDLLERAKERFAGAFHSFSLMMQTGAFLQLALALSAIAARLNSLIFAMNDALHMLCSAVSSVLEAVSGKKVAERKAKMPSELGEAPKQWRQRQDRMGDPRLGIGDGHATQGAVTENLAAAEKEAGEDMGRVLVRGSSMRASPSTHSHQQQRRQQEQVRQGEEPESPVIVLTSSAHLLQEEQRHQPSLLDASSASLWPLQSNEPQSKCQPHSPVPAVSLVVPGPAPSPLPHPPTEAEAESEPMPALFEAAPILILPNPAPADRQSPLSTGHLAEDQADGVRMKNEKKHKLLEDEVIEQLSIDLIGPGERTGKSSKKRKQKWDEIDEIFGSL